MPSRRLLALGFLLAIAGICPAKPPFLKVFVDTYKISPNSDLGKLKCLACHLPPAPPKRNPYGLDVQAAMAAAHSRMLTPEILKSIERKDSDGDGFTNLAEIRAGTAPGDKNSKPAKPGRKNKKGNRAVSILGSGYSTLGPWLLSLSLIGLVWRSSRRRGE